MPELSGLKNLASGIDVVMSDVTTESENKLVESLRNGEDQGFEKLVRTFGPQVLAVARRKPNLIG